MSTSVTKLKLLFVHAVRSQVKFFSYSYSTIPTFVERLNLSFKLPWEMCQKSIYIYVYGSQYSVAFFNRELINR